MPAPAVPGRQRFDRVTRTKMRLFGMHIEKRSLAMRIQRAALVIAGAAALAACGAATSPSRSATPSTAPTPSTTPTSGSGGGTPSPTPTRPSFEPLLIAFGGNKISDNATVGNEKSVLMLASGQTTVPMPSGPIVGGYPTLAIAGPFGARMIGTDGQQIAGPGGPVSIVAISSDGTLTTLEKNVAGSPSVIGRDDGQAWAWAVRTNSPACGSSTRATLDIYTDDGSGAKKTASVSFGAGVTEARLAAWTAAGIVVSGDNECGPFGASTLATSRAILINPATGAATGLAGRIGTDCSFQGIADDGTIACSVGGSAPGIRVIAPDGTQTNYSISSLTAPNSSLPRCADGVLLSADANFAAIALSCPDTQREDVVILDLASGHVAVAAGVDGLTPTLWTPDDVLVATVYGTEKTYSVTALGLVTLINPTYAAQTCINTC